MKKLIFVSTGRCGTMRITQILREKLSNRYSVVHQMRFSRLGNVVGHMMLYLGESDPVKKRLYSFITSRYILGEYFISTDPLTSMIVPNEYIRSKEVYIVHIVREAAAFAKSIHKFSRARLKSFVAHNFVPFWQPGVLPMENALGSQILKKYERAANFKNEFFEKKYAANPNYCRVHMNDLFGSNILQKIIKDVFDQDILISEQELETKAN